MPGYSEGLGAFRGPLHHVWTSHNYRDLPALRRLKAILLIEIDGLDCTRSNPVKEEIPFTQLSAPQHSQHLIIAAYRPVQIPNEVTVASMTPPVHFSSKTSQEADDNPTTVFHFGVVQGCHKTRSPNPFITLDLRL